MEPERGPGAYADSFARYITKQYGACGNTRSLDFLRQKIEKDAAAPAILVTEAGRYKLVP